MFNERNPKLRKNALRSETAQWYWSVRSLDTPYRTLPRMVKIEGRIMEGRRLSGYGSREELVGAQTHEGCVCVHTSWIPPFLFAIYFEIQSISQPDAMNEKKQAGNIASVDSPRLSTAHAPPFCHTISG